MQSDTSYFPISAARPITLISWRLRLRTLRIPLLLAPSRQSLRFFASVLFLIAAIGSYFVDTYGALLNKDMRRDTAIVFHLIGSHGPAYAERYPAKFEHFKPACRSNQLQRCTQEEIVNAYDNTIAYTDHVLSQQIALLRAAQNRVDSALIYVSDHGESLGEKGVYLHGMPYTFAPPAQKEVPLLFWTSSGYAERTRLNLGCLRATAHQPFSHDNGYHTVLGAAGVRNALYDPKLDMLEACRST